MDANEPVISTRALSRWHGDVIAVNDLTLDVLPGITGLLGPNGAGKTTLLRLAMGLQQPSAGEIRVLGANPWDNPRLLAKIGYVPDVDAPWRDLTARKGAQRAARFSGLAQSEAAAAAERTLGQVGLTNAADRVVGDFSRGMKQRYKFALALLVPPELMVLDEPLLGTDPVTRQDLVKLIKNLAANGTSVILSTHVLPDVEALTDRIALLNHGRLLAHGTVEEVRDLLDRYPRTVRVGTTAPREVGTALWKLETVRSVESDEGGVIVRTSHPQEFFSQLQELLASERLPFTSVVPVDENVEAIFQYLVVDQ